MFTGHYHRCGTKRIAGKNCRSLCFGCEFDQREVAAPPGLSPPSLISPTNGSVLDNNCQDRSDSIEWDFDWSDVSGATKYQIYVIHEGAQLPVINEIALSSSYHSSRPGSYIADANRFNWAWKVRAGNDTGQWSSWSAVRSFDKNAVFSRVDGDWAAAL